VKNINFLGRTQVKRNKFLQGSLVFYLDTDYKSAPAGFFHSYQSKNKKTIVGTDCKSAPTKVARLYTSGVLDTDFESLVFFHAYQSGKRKLIVSTDLVIIKIGDIILLKC